MEESLQDEICDKASRKAHTIKCEYSWPKEYTVSSRYCVQMKGELVISNGHIMSSTLGDVSHCSFESSHCLLGNDKHVFWKATSEEASEYKAPVNYTYVTVEDRYLINPLSLSLRLDSKTTYKGLTLWRTKEGFLINIITAVVMRSSNWDRYNFELNYQGDLCLYKRSLSDVRGELEGKVQYLFDYVYSFLGKTPMMCMVLNLHSRIMQSYALSHPTGFARAALGTTSVVAHATTSYLVVSPCITVKSEHLPYFNRTAQAVMVKAKLKNDDHVYYYDHFTGEITLHPQRNVHECHLPILIEINNTSYRLLYMS